MAELYVGFKLRDRRTLLRLYTSLIRPILDYNAFLLGNISSTNAHKLETIQNSALRIVTGGLRTTPVINLRVDTNIPSLQDRRTYQLLRFFARAASRPTQPSYGILSRPPTNRRLTKLQKQNPTISMYITKVMEDLDIQFPKILPTPLLTPYWIQEPVDTTLLFSDKKQDIHPTEIRTIFLQYKETHQDYIFIYTDGSSAEGRTGAAFTVNEYVMACRLSNSHSVYSSELSAIDLALQHIKKHDIKKQLYVQIVNPLSSPFLPSTIYPIQ